MYFKAMLIFELMESSQMLENTYKLFQFSYNSMSQQYK